MTNRTLSVHGTATDRTLSIDGTMTVLAADDTMLDPTTG